VRFHDNGRADGRGSRARSLIRLERQRQRIFRQIEQDEVLSLNAEHHADAERRIRFAIERLEAIAQEITRLDSAPPAHD